MTDPAALQKLLTWMSPAFPVGAFAWSSGLETAIAERRVRDALALQGWIVGGLQHGGSRTDAILVAEAHRGTRDLRELTDYCLALTPAAERAKDLLLTGDAFIAAAKAWPSDVFCRLPVPCPYPIAVGAVARAHGVELVDTLLAFLTAAVQAQASVAVRLVPLGQTDALRVVAALEPLVAALSTEAAGAGLDDVGAIAYAADIAQMRHETLEPRIFRS